MPWYYVEGAYGIFKQPTEGGKWLQDNAEKYFGPFRDIGQLESSSDAQVLAEATNTSRSAPVNVDDDVIVQATEATMSSFESVYGRDATGSTDPSGNVFPITSNWEELGNVFGIPISPPTNGNGNGNGVQPPIPITREQALMIGGVAVIGAIIGVAYLATRS